MYGHKGHLQYRWPWPFTGNREPKRLEKLPITPTDVGEVEDVNPVVSIIPNLTWTFITEEPLLDISPSEHWERGNVQALLVILPYQQLYFYIHWEQLTCVSASLETKTAKLCCIDSISSKFKDLSNNIAQDEQGTSSHLHHLTTAFCHYDNYTASIYVVLCILPASTLIKLVDLTICICCVMEKYGRRHLHSNPCFT